MTLGFVGRVDRLRSWILLAGLGSGLGACATEDGQSCKAWARPIDGRCTLSQWERPEAAISEPGARDVQVAVGASGQTLLAWTHSATNEGHIVVAESAGEGFTTQLVRLDAGTGLEPAVALSPDGEALLSWKQQQTDDAVYLATRDPAGTWQWPTADAPISWSPRAYEPRVRFGPDGEALIVWNQWTGQNFGVALGTRGSGDPHGEFSVPQQPSELLSPPVNFSNAPRIAMGSDGDVLVTWYQAPQDDLMVYVSERRGPDEPFSRPTAEGFLSAPLGPVDSHAEANPWPALHPSGSGAVVWTQQIDTQTTAVFVATRDPDGTWHRPASTDDALSPEGSLARCPQVAFAPDGRLMITWFATRGADTAVFARWGQSDEPLSEPLQLSAVGVEAAHPSLAIGPDGGAVVVFSEQVDTRWRVVARRYEPNDDRWFDPEPIGDAFEGQAAEPRLDIDPQTGRVVVAWAEGSVLDGRVFVATLP